MTPSENNTFSAADIGRYHDGSMPPAERHALEKAALEDPFLADALEGYAFTATPAADIAAIREKLEAKIGARRTLIIPAWLRVAALVLVLAGAGWFAYRTFSPQQSSIALEDRSPALPAGEPTNTTTAADSSATMPPASQTPVAMGKGQADTANPQQNQLAASNKEVEQTATDYRAADPVTDAVVAQDDHNERARNNTSVPITNQNRNAENRFAQPDPNANVSVNRQSNNYNTTTNNNTTSEVQVTNSRIAKSNADKLGDTIRHFDVVLHPLPSSAPSQEVVLSTGGEKKADMRKPKVTIDTLEPTGGWSRFDDYVASNLVTPEEIKLKAISGEVQLSFEVDKEGAPINITVVKSLCDQCDEEAIRLLKAGPKWKKKKNKNRKGKITIRF